MSVSKKYFYLKLKDNFFETDTMIVLESMPDGYKYSNILLKLYLKSIKNDGKLMLNDRIPFNSTMLANVTRNSIGDVEKAVKIFQDLGLIEILDNGAIYMLDIQNYIGLSSTEADRKREYREKLICEKASIGQMSSKCPDISPPEIEIEKEIKKEGDDTRMREYLDFRISKKSVKNPTGLEKTILQNLKDPESEESLKFIEWSQAKEAYDSVIFSLANDFADFGQNSEKICKEIFADFEIRTGQKLPFLLFEIAFFKSNKVIFERKTGQRFSREGVA